MPCSRSAKRDGGKTHLAAAPGPALAENGWRVPFSRTTDLVQRLQMAHRGVSDQAGGLIAPRTPGMRRQRGKAQPDQKATGS